MNGTLTIYTNFADDIADALDRASQNKAVIALHNGFGLDDYLRLHDAMSESHPLITLEYLQSTSK